MIRKNPLFQKKTATKEIGRIFSIRFISLKLSEYKSTLTKPIYSARNMMPVRRRVKTFCSLFLYVLILSPTLEIGCSSSPSVTPDARLVDQGAMDTISDQRPNDLQQEKSNEDYSVDSTPITDIDHLTDINLLSDTNLITDIDSSNIDSSDIDSSDIDSSTSDATLLSDMDLTINTDGENPSDASTTDSVLDHERDGSVDILADSEILDQTNDTNPSCPSGQKYCTALTQCIPENSCCIDSDCPSPRVCEQLTGKCVCIGSYSEPNPVPYYCYGGEEFIEKKDGSCVVWVKDKNCRDVCGRYRCMRELIVRSANSVNCKKPDGSYWDLQTIGNTGYPDVFAKGWKGTTGTKYDDCDFVDLTNESMGYYDMDITTNADWKVRLYDNDGAGIVGADWMATFDDSYWRNLAPGDHKISTTNSSGNKLYELNITIKAYQ